MVEPDEIPDPRAQRAGTQVARIDPVGEIADLAQHFALHLYAFRQGRAVVAKRVAPARF